MKTITVNVKIGKAKSAVSYMFLALDYLNVEDGELKLKNEYRSLKISPEEIENLKTQLDALDESDLRPKKTNY